VGAFSAKFSKYVCFISSLEMFYNAGFILEQRDTEYILL